jgi:hypothetical protein
MAWNKDTVAWPTTIIMKQAAGQNRVSFGAQELRPRRPGDGSTAAALRIFQTVQAPILVAQGRVELLAIRGPTRCRGSVS